MRSRILRIVPLALVCAGTHAFCQGAGQHMHADSSESMPGQLPPWQTNSAAAAPGTSAAPAAAVAAPAQTAGSTAPSLLNQPASPAAIRLNQGQLTIRATNSSLRSILDQLQTLTGTQIDGLSKDVRVFGVYGPGNPQEVLASLLDGTGYNVVIAGRRADGAPREVMLSLQTVGDTAPQPGTMTQAAQDDDDEDAPASQPFGGFEQTDQGQPPTSPGQLPTQAPGQVRTPAQMLQELQQMRQQAMQNQQQPQ